jgi:hypothetical protein
MKFPLLCICSIVSYDSLSCCILHLQNYLLRGLEDIQKSWPVSIMFFFETSVSIMLNCMSLLLASPLYSVISKIKKWIFIVFNFSGSTASHVCFGDKSTCVFLEKKKDKFEYPLLPGTVFQKGWTSRLICYLSVCSMVFSVVSYRFRWKRIGFELSVSFTWLNFFCKKSILDPQCFVLSEVRCQFRFPPVCIATSVSRKIMYCPVPLKCLNFIKI